MKRIHLFLATDYGEVMLIQGFNYSTQENFCAVYNGDDYYNFLGEIDGKITDNEELLRQRVNKLLGGE